MTIVRTNPMKIEGHWQWGAVLDYHTVSSIPTHVDEMGRQQYDTKRTEIGELLYLLKYRDDRQAAQPIIATIVNYLTLHLGCGFDGIVAVPPSKHRNVQPVSILAKGISEALGVPLLACIGLRTPSQQIKNVTQIEERQRQLENHFSVDARITLGKSILLFDDLIRSGATMNAVTRVLLDPGKAIRVYALAITKTRSKQ